MDSRIIAVIGAFDENGVYGIDSHLPWENENGRSSIKYDMGRFLYVTKETAPEGKQNVLIAGRSTAETFQMCPLPDRRMIVVSNTLDENEVNFGRNDDKKIVIARGLTEAMEKALVFDDCGHIFFIGGRTVWRRALVYSLCTHAFITIVQCDAVAQSPYLGKVHKAPEMLQDETYTGMKLECSTSMVDTWGDKEVELEFRNYGRT